jgi:hypothetical protein
VAARLLGLRVPIHPGTWISESWIVVFCQVEAFPSDCSLVQKSPTECGVSEYDLEASTTKKPWSIRGCWAMEKSGRF